jgi:hypothetical protein
MNIQTELNPGLLNKDEGRRAVVWDSYYSANLKTSAVYKYKNVKKKNNIKQYEIL